MGKFLTPLWLNVLGDRSYELLAPLEYQSDSGKIFRAEKGQTTDLGSTWGIPIVATRLDAVCQKACVIHDDNYRNGKVSRKEADEILFEAAYYEALENGKTAEEALELANTFYHGVRVFGCSSYKGKNESGN